MGNKIVIFDCEELYEDLLPLTYTRPSAEFRIGITTIMEKWEYYLPGSYSYHVVEHLREKFPLRIEDDETVIFIAGNIVPDKQVSSAINSLCVGDSLYDSHGLVAYRGVLADFLKIKDSEGSGEKIVVTKRINFVFDIFLLNPAALVEDYIRIVTGRESQPVDASVMIIGDKEYSNGVPSVFIEEGVRVAGCVLDVRQGPIYIGVDSEIMPGASLKGPLAICNKAKVKMGARIYGGTTIGPYCKVGGEIDNVVMFGYSNKAHDGYLGNAVIGEWCNIGAGTNASNLKNDYSKIRIWNYRLKSFMRTDLQFCGLIMGDHSKAGINCMFNTATVVGVGVNLHGSGFPRVFIPSFSEGSPEGGFANVSIKKFMDIALRVMSRRGLSLDDKDRRLFERIYESAQRFKK